MIDVCMLYTVSLHSANASARPHLQAFVGNEIESEPMHNANDNSQVA
jgi:hypothetical protein